MLEFFLGCYFLVAFSQQFPPEQPVTLYKFTNDEIVITDTMWIVPKRNEEGTISEETRLQIMNFLEQK